MGSRDAIEARSLRGVTSTARYNEQQQKAKARFTLRSKLTKTKYQQLAENYQDMAKVKARELKEALKQEKMSRTAMARLKNGGLIRKLRKAERNAVGVLTKADAMARIATRHALKSKEKAEKSATL